MKKILTILLTILILFTMVGCSNSLNSSMEKQPISTENYPIADIQQDEQDIAIVGGYTDVEDKAITDELKDMFNSAFDGFTGASYEPVELVATQVVAGTNYKFLANGTKTTNPIIKGTYYIYINKDLEGNISVLDIETIKESQEETKQEVNKEQDPTKLSYWVVFYNPDGHELYRTIMKYGLTPVYEGDTPSYWDSDNWYKFVCWTDKQGNEIKEFKPITGNTYIYAKYKMGGELKNRNGNVISSIPEPAPLPPACTETAQIVYFTRYHRIMGYYYNVYTYNVNDDSFHLTISSNSSTFSGVEVGKYYHAYGSVAWSSCVYVECADISVHTLLNN